MGAFDSLQKKGMCKHDVQMKKPSLHAFLCIAITRHKAIDLKETFEWKKVNIEYYIKWVMASQFSHCSKPSLVELD